jgi:hypothetical protein
VFVSFAPHASQFFNAIDIWDDIMPVEVLLVKLVRKLRWIGRDAEAREIERMLCRVTLSQWDNSLAEPMRSR